MQQLATSRTEASRTETLLAGSLPADVIWMPHPGSQTLALSCPHHEVFYHGERGPGKTDWIVMDFAKDVGQGFGSAWHGIVFRESYKDLKDVIERTHEYYPRIFPSAKYNASEHEWRFPDGEYLLMRYLTKPKDYNNYHGWQVPWMGFEELPSWATSELYLKMHSCSRSKHPGVAQRVRIRATGNPLGPGHNWVKKRFALGGSNHTRIITENGLTRCAIFGSLAENRTLLRSDPLYQQRVLNACKGNRLYIQAWVYGSWDVIAGGMFDDIWDPAIHVVEPFAVPRDWRVDRSFDWGSTKPFSVGWWAQSDGSDYVDKVGSVHATVRGDLFRIGEWYGCEPEESNVGLKLLSPQIAAGIVEREFALAIHDRCLPGPGDPSIFTETDGKSIAGTMSGIVRVDGQQYPGPTFFAADNSRVTGWDRVRTMLGNAKPGAEGMREHAGLFCVKTCLKLQELFPVTQRDKVYTDDVDSDTEDHLQDEVRYRCKAASLGAVTSGRVAGPAGDQFRRHLPGQPGRGRVAWR
jgi:hypothetical protein